MSRQATSRIRNWTSTVGAFAVRWKRFVWPLVSALALLHSLPYVVPIAQRASQRENATYQERKQREDVHDELIFAVSSGDVAQMQKIAAYDSFSLDHTGFRQDTTPLFAAIQSNQVKGVRFLLKRGVDVHATGLWGDTPLFIARRNGYTEIAQLLVAAGAKY